MKPTLYLAGKYSDRELLCTYASQLRANGLYVNSEWLEGAHDDKHIDSQIEYAEADLHDIDNSDIFVMVQNEQISGGRNVEFGYALAQGKEIYVIGPPSSIFHHLADECFASITELIEFIEEEGLYTIGQDEGL
jgi:nucleoside 2-deoxyribosyltransferase